MTIPNSKALLTERKKEQPSDLYDLSTIPDTLRKSTIKSRFSIRKSVASNKSTSRSLLKELESFDRYNMIERNKSITKLKQRLFPTKVLDSTTPHPKFNSLLDNFPPTLQHFVWDNYKLSEIVQLLDYHTIGLHKLCDSIKHLKAEMYLQIEASLRSICNDVKGAFQYMQAQDEMYKEKLKSQSGVNKVAEEAMEKYKLETDKYLNALIVQNKAKEAEISHLKGTETILQSEVARLRDSMRKYTQTESDLKSEKKDKIMEDCKTVLKVEKDKMSNFVEDLERSQAGQKVVMNGMKNLLKQIAHASNALTRKMPSIYAM